MGFSFYKIKLLNVLLREFLIKLDTLYFYELVIIYSLKKYLLSNILIMFVSGMCIQKHSFSYAAQIK